MDSLSYLILILTMGITFSACGVKLGSTTNSSPATFNPGQKLQLQGSYIDLNGNSVQLDQLATTTQVIIFAQDTCSVCSQEAKDLVSYAQVKGAPSSFQIRHILVGSNIQDASDWVSYHKIPWPVGITKADLFTYFCPERKVPCLIVAKPGQGVIYQHVGALSIDQITEVAGKWPQN